jgi:hypothetical protein
MDEGLIRGTAPLRGVVFIYDGDGRRSVFKGGLRQIAANSCAHTEKEEPGAEKSASRDRLSEHVSYVRQVHNCIYGGIPPWTPINGQTDVRDALLSATAL